MKSNNCYQLTKNVSANSSFSAAGPIARLPRLVIVGLLTCMSRVNPKWSFKSETDAMNSNVTRWRRGIRENHVWRRCRMKMQEGQKKMNFAWCNKSTRSTKDLTTPWPRISWRRFAWGDWESNANEGARGGHTALEQDASLIWVSSGNSNCPWIFDEYASRKCKNQKNLLRGLHLQSWDFRSFLTKI